MAFRQLIEKCDKDEIKFWRTVQKNEVDFVIKEKNAYEVKADPGKFKEKSYKTFIDNYPDIELAVVSFDAKETTVNKHPLFNVWEI